MGIRVHKMCGYALTDVKPGDPRINWDSPAFRHELGKKESLAEFLRFCEGVPGAAIEASIIYTMKEERSRRRLTPQDAIVWGNVDGGLESVLCLHPVSMPDWHRYDDILDWLEETYHRDQENWVEVLPHGIFPWTGLYMDSRTGVRLPNDVLDWVRAFTGKDYEKRSKLVASGAADEMAGRFGMTHHEARMRVVPLVPDSVRLLARWANLFNDEETWRQLRPVIYTWWA